MTRRLAAPTRVGQGGYSLLEIIVAMTVLSLGSAVLWYTLRSSARLEKLNRLHHEANILARSELEILRGVPRRDIRDTSYRVAVSGGEELMVVREVFDSAKVVSSLKEVALDENLSPAELRKPLEVRVRVFRRAVSEDGGIAWPLPEWDGEWESGEGEDEERRTLSALVLKIPEYRWH